jgi:hypothetical protein
MDLPITQWREPEKQERSAMPRLTSIFKKAFNTARLTLRRPPIIVRTSEDTSCWIKEGKGPKVNTSGRIIAEAAEGWLHPEKKLWTVVATADVPDDSARVAWRKTMTYDAMLAFLKQAELGLARGAGLTGTDEEITARRKPFVAADNVLRFTK